MKNIQVLQDKRVTCRFCNKETVMVGNCFACCGQHKNKPDKQTHSNCLECGKKFIRKRYWQKFCNSKCKWKSWAKRHPRVSIEKGSEND